MRADILLLNAGALATLGGPPGPRRGKALGDVGLRAGAGVAIRGGQVVEVGPSRRIRAKYRARRTVDAEGRLVTPGFVDPHTHLPFAGHRSFELRLKLAGRSYEEILRAGGGIHRTVRDTRRASLSDLTRLVRERTRTMLAWGTTTAEAKSGYGLELKAEAKQLEAVRRASDPRGVELVPTFLGAHALPARLPHGRKRWVEEIAYGMVPYVAERRLAEFVDVFVEPSAFHPEEARAILTTAKLLGLGVKVHADEFTNTGGAEMAADLEAASCDHLLKVSPKGIRRLAKSETMAVLLPGVAALGFLEHQAPARRMVEAGVAIALGTDFNPNCPVLTMPTVLQWAVYQLRLTPEEALCSATTNAAHALGRGKKVGRIEPGFQADLLVHEHEGVEELAYWVGPNPVRTVIKAGRIVTTRA